MKNSRWSGLFLLVSVLSLSARGQETNSPTSVNFTKNTVMQSCDYASKAIADKWQIGSGKCDPKVLQVLLKEFVLIEMSENNEPSARFEDIRSMELSFYHIEFLKKFIGAALYDNQGHMQITEAQAKAMSGGTQDSYKRFQSRIYSELLNAIEAKAVSENKKEELLKTKSFGLTVQEIYQP